LHKSIWYLNHFLFSFTSDKKKNRPTCFSFVFRIIRFVFPSFFATMLQGSRETGKVHF